MRLALLISLSLVLIGCGAPRGAAPLVPGAAQVGTVRDVYVVTNREAHPDKQFGIERTFETSHLRLGVSVPPERQAGSVSNGQGDPDPRTDFALVSRADHDGRAAFRADLNRAVRSADGSVAIFVHGYNNTFSDPVFRIAQMAHDLQLPSALVALAWPSRANPLGYQYDVDSTYFSREVMRDALFDIAATNPTEFVLVAHSMGSIIALEALRQIEMTDPGWAARHLNGVILMAPDLNVDVFRQIMRGFSEVPQPFVIFVSDRDIALHLSAQLRGDEVRLGNLTDPTPLANLPVQIIDVSAFGERRRANHLTAAASPAVLAILNAALDINRDFAGSNSGGAQVLPGHQRILRKATQIILVPLR